MPGADTARVGRGRGVSEKMAGNVVFPSFTLLRGSKGWLGLVHWLGDAEHSHLHLFTIRSLILSL